MFPHRTTVWRPFNQIFSHMGVIKYVAYVLKTHCFSLCRSILVICGESMYILHNDSPGWATHARLATAASLLHAIMHVAVRKPGDGMTQRWMLGGMDRLAFTVRFSKRVKDSSDEVKPLHQSGRNENNCLSTADRLGIYSTKWRLW